MKKRGQVTIFIIVAIVIISIVALFFIFRGGVKIPGIGIGKEISPSSFLESCMEDKIREGIEIISLQGGYINNPLHISYLFEDKDSPANISYLCYTQKDPLPCVNQEPMLIQHLKNEIYDYVKKDVNKCFTELGESLEKQGYDVDPTYRDFEVDLIEGKVIINIDTEITLTLTKTGETSKQEDFKIITPSRFYDLAIVVQEIISKEVMSCDFESVGYMLLYPQWDIDKTKLSDSTIIYIVEHKESKEKFQFAIRGCASSPGYF